MPLDRMLIETESPFMIPSSYRGKRNKPAYLRETAQIIAEIRGEDLEAVCETLYRNSLDFFNIRQ